MANWMRVASAYGNKNTNLITVNMVTVPSHRSYFTTMGLNYKK
jgi:hypothetical protein